MFQKNNLAICLHQYSVSYSIVKGYKIGYVSVMHELKYRHVGSQIWKGLIQCQTMSRKIVISKENNVNIKNVLHQSIHHSKGKKVVH